jgi:hypothetical protein
MAHNEPGKGPAVEIEEAGDVPFSRRLTVPPLSASIYVLDDIKK